ncbi:MAG: alpha/beta hydrolase [Candidatus Andersenbacteria bacterium]|nr:alpha/beta hydrolase [Candidatus Andersenbacteria bacterium]MBI3250875.1 alpha/beta hydrolase [Candidatus Andersenbacteria bacterium]
MKQQVFVIHGGTSFDTHEDYISFLKTRELTLERLTQGEDWKASLSDELGESFEVLVPKMPNGTNVRYLEWQIWFERCIPFIQDNAILIGQSLGGIFLAKYLSENSFPKSIRATLLVGAPFDDTSTVESLTDFVLPSSLEKFATQSEAIYLIHSKDDPVVPVEQTEKYMQALPKAQKVIFDDRGHFNQKKFPEVVSLIQSL